MSALSWQSRHAPEHRAPILDGPARSLLPAERFFEIAGMLPKNAHLNRVISGTVCESASELARRVFRTLASVTLRRAGPARSGTLPSAGGRTLTGCTSLVAGD